MGARDLLHTPNIILVGVGINAIKLMGLYSIPYLCIRAIGIDYFSLVYKRSPIFSVTNALSKNGTKYVESR